MFIFFLSGGSKALADDDAYRTITDRSGRQVRIPQNPRHIACLFGPSYEKMLALGARDRISMVANVTLPWNFVINPGLVGIPVLNHYGSPDVEALLKNSTDLVIYHPFAKQIERLSAAGLPVVVAYDGSRRMQTLDAFFEDWYGQIRFYGDVLGGQAPKIAADYCSYADAKIRQVTDVTSQIPKAQRPKVFWVCGQVSGPSGTQTRHSTADWIVTAAGGTMLTHDDSSYFVSVSTEELMLWNPDIIIVSTLPSVTPVLSDPRLKNVAAVKNKKVYMTPQGQFYWSHFSTESFLCILYLAKLFLPDQFPDIDLIRELTDYYTQFYHYNLTPDQARRILSHFPPGSEIRD
jgi:iron complex transport system substrate-binding protein